MELERKLPIKIVCISDTHNNHDLMSIPEGDVLICAGDYTHFGREEHRDSFNTWLGTLPHKHKIVVNGNHECNAVWKREVSQHLSNATVLVQEEATVENLRIFGTNFFWPMGSGPNPNYTQIPEGLDILITHGPVKGFVDNNCGCPSLADFVRKLRPRLVICGHIHGAHGVVEGDGEFQGITFVNAAICKNGYTIGWEPVVVTL
jgi:Icc-related predicted phosphoesterase